MKKPAIRNKKIIKGGIQIKGFLPSDKHKDTETQKHSVRIYRGKLEIEPGPS